MKPEFLEGVKHYNCRRFFEAHESWEKIWFNSGHEKKFLQGLIQIAAGYYHFERNNIDSALSLLERGSGYVSCYDEDYMNIKAGNFIGKVRNTISMIKQGKQFEFPGIKLIKE